MRELVDGYRFTGGGTCFVYSDPQYMFNETNKVDKANKVDKPNNVAERVKQ